MVFWDSRRQNYTIQNTSPPSQRVVVPQQVITHFPADAAQSSCTKRFPLTINCHAILLSRCATLPQRIFLLPKYFPERLPRLFHLLRFTSLNPSTTAQTSLLPWRRTHLNRIQNPFSLFLDLPHSFPHLLTLRHNVYTRSKRQLNSFSDI